jgi:glutathione S-transferase
MIRLYQFATSPFCEKVRRLLNFKRRPFEIVEVDRTRLAGYAGVSPRGKFPTLEQDGKLMWDSTEIAYHLDKAFPDPPLIPHDPDAAALVHVFEDWADESLYFYEVALRLAREHNIDRALPGFQAGLPGVPLEKLRGRILAGAQTLVTAQGLGRKSAPEVTADVARHIAALESRLSARVWLVGGAPSLADIAVASQLSALSNASEVEPMLARAPNLTRWLERVDALASPTALATKPETVECPR